MTTSPDQLAATGLDRRTAGAAAYLGVVGPVLLVLEWEDREVRYHAARSSLLWLTIASVSALWPTLVAAAAWVAPLGRPLTIVAAAAVARSAVQGYRLERVEVAVELPRVGGGVRRRVRRAVARG